MRESMRSLRHRWSREQGGTDGIQRRRALLARDRRERASANRLRWLETQIHDWPIKEHNWATRNRDLADKLKALHDRIPVYARVQRYEQHCGRTLVIPISFNPDAVIRALVFSTAERDRSLDLDREFRYLVDLASQKILASLREAAAELLGMPRSPR